MIRGTAVASRRRPRGRRARVALAGASLLVVTMLALTGLSANGTAASVNFASGSLIIPMDTDTSGNHASYNQNLGMWEAHGLVYKLLQNDIPVRWAVVRGDARLAARIRLVALAQASNASRVGDTSRLVVLTQKVTHQGGYTG